MSSRCRCCDIKLSWRDFRVLREDGQEEDLCSSCRSIAFYPECHDTREYQFESLTERYVQIERFHFTDEGYE